MTSSLFILFTSALNFIVFPLTRISFNFADLILKSLSHKILAPTALPRLMANSTSPVSVSSFSSILSLLISVSGSKFLKSIPKNSPTSSKKLKSISKFLVTKSIIFEKSTSPVSKENDVSNL